MDFYRKLGYGMGSRMDEYHLPTKNLPFREDLSGLRPLGLDELPAVPKKKQKLSVRECIFNLAFIVVFLVLFLAGPEQRTIPREMFAGLREQINPTILAVATLLILLSLALLFTLEMLRRRSERMRMPAHVTNV